MSTNPEKTISIHTLPGLVNTAFNSPRSNIISSFNKPRLWPLNCLEFGNEDFISAAVTDRPFATNILDRYVCFINYLSNMPGCSKDSNDMELLSQKSNTMLSPQDVRPYPKVRPRTNSTKGRKKGKPRILMEAPEKIRLEEEIKDRNKRKGDLLKRKLKK
ncbi:hypothetical protein QE152_g1968 [Popillia japonica]|uniref:Uncharacterized protein n=1 Tax=Popillia japonica TaxID=7064 RepID=A0AAW1N305_POPJA